MNRIVRRAERRINWLGRYPDKGVNVDLHEYENDWAGWQRCFVCALCCDGGACRDTPWSMPTEDKLPCRGMSYTNPCLEFVPVSKRELDKRKEANENKGVSMSEYSSQPPISMGRTFEMLEKENTRLQTALTTAKAELVDSDKKFHEAWDSYMNACKVIGGKGKELVEMCEAVIPATISGEFGYDDNALRLLREQARQILDKEKGVQGG